MRNNCLLWQILLYRIRYINRYQVIPFSLNLKYIYTDHAVVICNPCFSLNKDR